MNPKIAHGERKIRLFTKPSNLGKRMFGYLFVLNLK